MSAQSEVVRIPVGGISLDAIVRTAIEEALRLSDWVQVDAARLLRISPRTLNYQIKAHNIVLPPDHPHVRVYALRRQARGGA
jgi:DNA-binding NtrC family response regulator